MISTWFGGEKLGEIAISIFKQDGEIAAINYVTDGCTLSTRSMK